MTHVLDELELYVLGVLPPATRAEVEAHLVACDGCRAEAAALTDVISAMHDALPVREPPLALRQRILASAGTRVVRPAPATWLRPVRAWLPAGALAAAAVVLAVLSVGLVQQLDATRAELAGAQARSATTQAIAERVSHGGRSWYMSGVEQWKGAGGMLFVPQGAPAYVVFHDLPPVPAGANYTIWLVDAEGRWVRGASFAPAESGVRMVDVGVPVEGFDRCAVTLETQTTGKRSGPIVMQSRMY
ncbi:MAG TPA: anti-sigma factor [Candidatus Limnocylindria bacterium]|nr:anti-sigma factor [Candidatus Limnocylindria bacterium]